MVTAGAIRSKSDVLAEIERLWRSPLGLTRDALHDMVGWAMRMNIISDPEAADLLREGMDRMVHSPGECEACHELGRRRSVRELDLILCMACCDSLQ